LRLANVRMWPSWSGSSKGGMVEPTFGPGASVQASGRCCRAVARAPSSHPETAAASRANTKARRCCIGAASTVASSPMKRALVALATVLLAATLVVFARAAYPTPSGDAPSFLVSAVNHHLGRGLVNPLYPQNRWSD